jgi:putative SOS response-associated peptidase YedK
MCYNVASATKKKLTYAKHRNDDIAYIHELEKQLEELSILTKPHYHVSGFAHPSLLVFTNKSPLTLQAFRWGLVPSWVKDLKTAKTISLQTLNARSETIFEKPSFRIPANEKRCLIYIDAFYEHHYVNGKTYPFHISMADDSPLILAGLWDEWIDKETGEILKTVSIVTCIGNKTLTKIHNNPKAEGPRMPVILSRENQDQWLQELNGVNTKDALMPLAIPFPDEKLKYHTVHKILGKSTLGNIPEAEQPYKYPEITFEIP